MSSTTVHALSALLETAGIEPEHLLTSLTKALANPTNTPEVQPMATARSITVKGVTVPAPTPGMKITQEVKKAYNSALSRTGNGTLGSGGATYENLKAKFELLGGVGGAETSTVDAAGNPLATLLTALNGATAEPASAPTLNEVLAKMLSPKQSQPGTLRHHISNYQKKDKTRVWVKNDGTRVPCTEEQYALWSQRRAENQRKNAVVRPSVPQDVDVNALLAALTGLLAQQSD